MKAYWPQLTYPKDRVAPPSPITEESTGLPLQQGNGQQKGLTTAIKGLLIFVHTGEGLFRQIDLTPDQSRSVLGFIKHRLHGGRLVVTQDGWKEIKVR